MKPNAIGPKILYTNPGLTEFTTAVVAAVDGPIGAGAADFTPFCPTNVVAIDYDEHNFASIGETIVNLDAGMRFCYGLFLTPENEKGNLIFQLSGCIDLETTARLFKCNFIFGRRGTSNSVVFDAASRNNALDKYIIVPPTAISHAPDDSGDDTLIHMSVVNELFTKQELSPGFVYFFGIAIDNTSGAVITMNFLSSLAFRKYTTELPHFLPSGI